MSYNDEDAKSVMPPNEEFSSDKKSRTAPVFVRLAADVSLLLLGFSLAVVLGLGTISDSDLPVIELSLTALLMGFLLAYRRAKKWAFFAIGGLYAINLGTWALSAYQGAPPEFERLVISSAIPLTILLVGAANWKEFS
jgi:hypothetical protein